MPVLFDSGMCYAGIGIIVTVLLLLNSIVRGFSAEALLEFVGPAAAEFVDAIVVICFYILRHYITGLLGYLLLPFKFYLQKPLGQIQLAIPEEYHVRIVRAVAVVSGCLVILSQLFLKNERVLPKEDLRRLRSGLKYVEYATERKVNSLCIENFSL